MTQIQPQLKKKTDKFYNKNILNYGKRNKVTKIMDKLEEKYGSQISD